VAVWYAGYLRERLGALLDASFTKSELVDFVSGGPGTHDYCAADSVDEIDFATCEEVEVFSPVDM
jgi:hypothetical protein